MERNYSQKGHRNEITWKRDGKTALIFKISKTYHQVALKRAQYFVFKKKTKEARWSCVDYPWVKIIWKIYIKMTPIIRPSKLHQNSMSKWRENSSILTFRRNFDIDSTCWVCRYNRTKLVLVSTQNHCCFNVKFWCCFDVEKMTLFRRWNTVIFNVNIKITISQAL